MRGGPSADKRLIFGLHAFGGGGGVGRYAASGLADARYEPTGRWI